MKEENKAIFGGCNCIDKSRWIIIDNAQTLSSLFSHVFIFDNFLKRFNESKEFISSDSVAIKPSIEGYISMSEFLKKKGYIFNKKTCKLMRISL